MIKKLLVILSLLVGGQANAQLGPFYTKPADLIHIHTTLTSAQILNLLTTPVTVIPAPGVGLVTMLVQGQATLNFKTTAYSGSSLVLVLRFANAPAGAIITQTVNPFLTATQTTMNGLRGWALTDATSTVENQAIIVQNGGGAATLGDGTITFDLFYIVVPSL